MRFRVRRLRQQAWFGLLLRLAVALVTAALVAMGALFLVSAVTGSPGVFLIAGAATFVAASAVFAVVATRKIPSGPRQRARTRVVPALVLAAMVLFVITALLPVGDPQRPPAPVDGQGFWVLPTGSRIAYVRVGAVRSARRDPVVFLHGGPGVPDMKGDAAFFGRLARDGRDVYVYDQVGTGRSSRLADPRGYTVGRDAADLEAIRRRVGARRMVLVGHSYGAQLAARYLADHPDRVSRVVFSSPGSLDPDVPGGDLTARLDLKQKLQTYALTVRPRVLLAYGLLQVNPRAAHAFVGDGEMDARFDRLYRATEPAVRCDGAPLGPARHGLGMYANAYPQSASARASRDVRPALRRLRTPALIIKGACDYEPWSTGTDYRRSLRSSRLVYLPGAGHDAYHDRPEIFLATLRAFLKQQRMPVAPLGSLNPPQSYEGPVGSQ